MIFVLRSEQVVAAKLEPKPAPIAPYYHVSCCVVLVAQTPSLEWSKGLMKPEIPVNDKGHRTYLHSAFCVVPVCLRPKLKGM